MPETLGPSPEEMGIQPEQPSNLELIEHWKSKVDKLYVDQNSTWNEQVHAIKGLAAVKRRAFDALPVRGNLDAEETEINKKYIGLTMQEAREKIPPEIGTRFDAHGIAKTEQLENLLNILENGIDKDRTLHTLQLRNTPENEHAASGLGASAPYDHGGFILVSHPDKKLAQDGVALVMVNYQYRESAKLLAKKFPNVLFATPEGTQKALEHLLNESKKKDA